MKYLKKRTWSQDDVTPIEELSEYLQELFDKYHIRKWNTNFNPDEIRLTDIFWENTDTDELMIATYRGDIPPHFDDLKDDVMKLHKLLQIRLGTEIRISFGEATVYFNI